MNIHDIFNFRAFLRFLGKHKLYTFIELFGLSVSLMFVILIAVYTKQELSTDNFQKNKDRLYLLVENPLEADPFSPIEIDPLRQRKVIPFAN